MIKNMSPGKESATRINGSVIKGICIILLTVILYPVNNMQAQIVSGDQPGKAEVYLYRIRNFAGSANRMTIMANGQPIARLKNGSFYKYQADPGDYVFSLFFGSESKVKLTVEAGKSYYIKCYYNMGFWSGIPVLELVDPVSGKAFIAGNALAELPDEPVSTGKSGSRIGVTMSGGFGFESYPFFVDEDNKEVTLSTGGGFGIGAEFGQLIGKSFDISIGCFYQGSMLSENLNNASASFSRMGLTLTPAVIIPLKGGDAFRFRMGAGAGLYNFGTMKVDASELGDTKYTFKYKSTIGFHGVVLFEANFSEHGSFNLGIRYNNIHYQYKAEGSSHSVTDPKLENPDGSGIDFLLGYHFCF